MGGCQSAPTEAADGPQAQPQQQQRVKHQDQPNHTASSNVSTQPTLQPRHSFDRDATEVSRTTTSAAGTPAQNSVDRGAAGSTTTTTAGTTTTAASSTTITPEQLENINPNRPLPTDVDGLRTMVQQLQHALAVRELALQERERELQAEKAQRVQSATGVLNQAIKIIRPSTTAGSQKRESISSLGAERSGNNQMGISPSLIQLHERQKAAAAEAASAASDSAATISSNNPALSSSDSSSSSFSLSNPLPPTLERSPSILPTPVSSSSLQQQAAARDASGSLDSQEEESTLRRELMGVLLAFAENELIAPHSSGGGAGERKYSADGSERSRSGGPTQNFAAVINSSILDDTTKAWLTAEYTRDQPAMGAGTRQRHVSVFNAQRGQPAFAPSNTSSSNPDDFPQNGTSTPGGGSSSSSDSSGGEANHASMIYANSRLLISPDLVSLAELASWEFDPTSYTPELLIVQSFKMFESLDLLKRFAIDPVKLSNFMMELERNYIASNPYHNFRHGIDVLHCCWMYLRTSSVVAQARLRSLDLLAFMLSAVCHDLGHPGTTNLYQINTCSELAMVVSSSREMRKEVGERELLGVQSLIPIVSMNFACIFAF
jgi:hypothetical protein